MQGRNSLSFSERFALPNLWWRYPVVAGTPFVGWKYLSCVKVALGSQTAFPEYHGFPFYTGATRIPCQWACWLFICERTLPTRRILISLQWAPLLTEGTCYFYQWALPPSWRIVAADWTDGMHSIPDWLSNLRVEISVCSVWPNFGLSIYHTIGNPGKCSCPNHRYFTSLIDCGETIPQGCWHMLQLSDCQTIAIPILPHVKIAASNSRQFMYISCSSWLLAWWTTSHPCMDAYHHCFFYWNKALLFYWVMPP